MTLADFWFIVLAVLWTGFFLLEGFDFGVGMLHGVVGRDEGGRDQAIRTIGPVWDGNEVWLIVAVAVTFAAFPDWYATMLSGFYPIFVVVLLALILRGVSFEFRAHAPGERSRRFWGGALTVGSFVTPLGLGIVVGSLLGGVPLDAQHEFVGGVGDLFGPYAVTAGVTLTLICLLHGAAFLALRTHGDVRQRAQRIGRILGPITVVVVIGYVVATRIDSGRGVLWSAVEFGAVIAVITAAVLIHADRDGAAFAATCATTAAVVVALFAELYPRVMVSSLGAANDLTVAEAASSPYALWVMTATLALLLPVVLIYQAWTYYVFRARVGGRDGDGAEAPPRPPSGAAVAHGTAGSGSRVDGHAGPGSLRAEVRRDRPSHLASPSRGWPRLAWLVIVWFLAWLFSRMRALFAPGHVAGR
jgi:cytochrome d ubiquinol oxidase subunit II